ncbi:MAG: RluA family pseudouridine synthase, partial [Anaerolineales bacterium]
MSEQKFSFTVSGENKQRLDKFLVSSLPDLSRARIQALIKEGFVQVSGQE